MDQFYSIDSDPAKGTHDIRLLAALTAMGVPLGNPPCLPSLDRHGKEKWQFLMGVATMDGKYTTRDLVGFWADKSFESRNPEHPFAYICAALRNHRSLLDAIKGIRPLAQIQKGPSIALIHVDAPNRTQDIILGGLR